ncbi:MFS transporter [Stackebrandtia nassauensis]|uniref:Major facilitator superfamily MFS_1 n=1 Tax=Stackebrandtia nassauensis (strain DSM 44728 / CIP 108903 / NRRL B-16338 / NBRC 102104 / LLR-40K-21) TaxID=446470 RepID=D3Q2A2_STANL|nr:MFS transporter [Stackebrandtia nassauensis]ADD43835.1 major facilitator superfamily MFS_1 [Stackebrandtia nassauensis DSM 44728]
MDTTVDTARVQRSTLRLLFTTQIIGGVGVAVGIAVGALLLDELTGGASLSGLGSAASVIGGALLTIPIVRITNRFGRRYGLTFSYVVGTFGSLAILGSVYWNSIPLAFLGMLAFGGGTAANLQARYAAVDLAEPSRRGRQLSMVVWATTLGSVSGPSLAPLADRYLTDLGAPTYAGPFLASAIGFAVAALTLWILLRPDPFLLARRLRDESNGDTTGKTAAQPGIAHGWRVYRTNAAARVGVTAVALGHLVMVAVMTMTPVHIKHGVSDPDQVISIVGIILSLHIAGMYALSPIAGWAADKYGPRRVIGCGIALLLAACAVSGTAGQSHPQLAIGLILLGLGWSGTLVGGSAMLTAAVPAEQRPAIQGLSDLTMGCAGALAGGLSGFIVDAAGYPTLAAVAALVALPVTVLVLNTRVEGN